MVLSGTLFTRNTRSKQLDKNNAKLIKASVYANKNLRYHLDERHKKSEDGYSKATDTMAWADKIKSFVGYKLDPLVREISKHLRAPMCAGFSSVSLLTLANRRLLTRLRKVMGAYTDDRPYSLDLVSAVSALITNIRPQGPICAGNRHNDREPSPTRCIVWVGVNLVSLIAVRTR